MISFKLKYFIFLLLVYSNISAQNVFELQSPFYNPESINTLKFVNQTGWAAGNNGLVLKTTNGGLNFIQQFFPSKANIIKLSQLDSLYCFALEDSSGLFSTSNGGINWTKFSSFNAKINDVQFINHSKGFVASDLYIGITSNSGLNWSFITPDSASQYMFLTVHFFDSQTGFVSAVNRTTNYSYIFKTTNSGINWTWYNTSVDAFEINKFYFINPLTGWCTGKRFDYLYAMKTSNGGVNWTESHSSVSSAAPDNIFFGTGNTGYITTPLKIIKSTNGGLNWFTFVSSGGILASHFINETNYYLADNVSRIFKSAGTGTNFDTLLGKYNQQLMKIQCIDAGKLWCNGLNYANWKSTNGGSNWILDAASASLNIHYTQFADAFTGFSIAGRGTVYKTTDFGSNWNYVFNYPSEMYSFCFLNPQTAWALADNSIFKTTNSGINWTQIPNPDNIRKSNFTDNLNGYGMNNNYFFRTSNGGYNWTQCSPDIISDYSFINSQTGWIVSNIDTTSVIKRTTNSGTDWYTMSVLYNSINNIEFINQSTGYLLTYDRLYRTTNGGSSWKFAYISNTLRTFGMDILDANTGWLCGDNGLINKLINGSAIFVNNDDILQPDFHLYQNYPNPFNSSTNIRFTINKQSHTSLKVYDIQGREVAVLINRFLTPDSYTIKFDNASLSSGVYFYTLTTNNKSITKKLLLLK